MTSFRLLIAVLVLSFTVFAGFACGDGERPEPVIVRRVFTPAGRSPELLPGGGAPPLFCKDDRLIEDFSFPHEYEAHALHDLPHDSSEERYYYPEASRT